MSTSELVNKMTGFEMQIRSLRSSIPKMFKNYKRITRLTLVILISILIETLEFSYSLSMTEEYAIHINYYENFRQASYYNVFAISGVRYMVGFIHQVPILNIIPGQGLGISDLVLRDSTELIVQSKHEDIFDQTIINNISQQSTLIIKLFNFYFKKIIALIVVTIMIFNIFLRSIKNDNDDNE